MDRCNSEIRGKPHRMPRTIPATTNMPGRDQAAARLGTDLAVIFHWQDIHPGQPDESAPAAPSHSRGNSPRDGVAHP